VISFPILSPSLCFHPHNTSKFPLSPREKSRSFTPLIFLQFLAVTFPRSVTSPTCHISPLRRSSDTKLVRQRSAGDIVPTPTTEATARKNNYTGRPATGVFRCSKDSPVPTLCRTIVQAVRRWHATTEPPVQSTVTSCEIHDGPIGI
jgi:hypothetical protein